MNKQRILIVGISAGGAASLPQDLVRRIIAADVLAGGRRHLDYFPDFSGERLLIAGDIDVVVRRLQRAVDGAEQAVVLASGDPMWYGIGTSLRQHFPADVLEVAPAPTACQLAFAALAESWHDAAFFNAHSRPLPDVIQAVCRTGAPKAAILTDNVNTPAAIARALIAAGISCGVPGRDTPCAVCENLGSPEQRIMCETLGKVAEATFAPLNVFIIWLRPDTGSRFRPDRVIGLPDEAYSTSGGLITKREVRLLSLTELGLGASELMWDIGAGSGAVGIEASRSQPSAVVYAIEQRARMVAHLSENARRFAPALRLIEGKAPEACTDLPDPDAVFIGGSGGRMQDIIEMVRQRLRPGGRMVLNVVTLENLQTARMCLPDAAVTQVQISRGVPILDMLRFDALNPVFIISWRKE